MRVVGVLLVVLVLAGCASQGSAPATTSVPATSQVATPSGAPKAGSVNETPVYQLQKTFDAASAPYTADFEVPKAGWLCVHVYLQPTAGSAAITLVDPANGATTVASTRDGTLKNDTVLANDAPGTWHVRIDLSGYSGEVGVLVSQMG